MTQNAATPHARLVVSRELLLKAAHHHDGMYKHGGGYYLLNGRWHKLRKDKPAPKGAPVAAHPKSGGDHAAVAHFTQEQWDALKLPDTNTNAPSYNKALANLQQLSDAGNVTGMLAISYGSNTYGQKLAKIANHLLGLHGSKHQVAPGQKAGTHAALQSVPAEPHPTGLPEHLAPKTTPDLQEPGPLAPLAQHVKDTLDEKAAEGNVDFLKMVAANNPEHPQIVAYAKQKLAELGGKPATPPATPIATPTTPSLPPGAKLSTDVNASPLVHTTTPEAAAAIQKDGFKLSGNSMYGKGVYFSSAAQSDAYGSAVLGAKLKPHKQLVLAKDSDVSKAFTALTGLSSGHLGSDKGAQAMIDAGVGSMVFPVDDETYTVVFDPGLIDVQANNPEHPQVVAYANKLLERLGANEEQGAPAAGTYDHGGIKKPISGKKDESGTLSNAATGWLHAYQWGVDSPAGDVKNPIPSDDVIKELSAFVGKSPVKLYRAVYLDANDSGKLVESWTRHEEHASVLVQSNAEMGKKMKIISQVFQPADIIVDTTKLPKKFHNANDSGTQAEVVIALGSLKKHVAKLRATTPAPTGPLAMPAFEEGKTTTGVKAYYEKVAQKVIDHGHAGNASVLEGMKEDGLKPNAKGKTTNTWLGKTANSKKLLALHAAALAHAAGGAAPAADDGPNEGDTKPGADGQSLVFKNGRWHKYVAADESGEVPAVLVPVADAPAAAPAITPETGNLSAQQLGNLQSIPWHKLKLPAENTNAKSHNAALAKIEAMAFAGDTAGLQAFIDAKGGAKQTYAKKQVLTAQTALAGLGTPGATAAVPVEPAPEPANPHILTEDQEVGLLNWMAAGKPTSNKPGSWSKLWGALPAGLKAELKSIHEATASKAAATTIDPEQKQVLDELAAGEHWVDLEDLAEMHGPGTQVHAYAQKLLTRKPTPEQMDAAAPAAPAPQAPAKVKVAGKVYENTLNGHNKFWAVSTHGSVMKTTYGKIGTKGQETVKHFPSEAAAQTAAAKLTAEKKAKGYNMAGFVEHEHDAPGGPTPAAQPQGPKEGDTKQGADGMLVLKDGHWVKMNQGPKALTLWDVNNFKATTAGYSKQVFTNVLKPAAMAGDAAAIQKWKSENTGKMPNTHNLADKLLAAMGAAESAPAAGAASWEFDQSNMGFGGAPTLVSEVGNKLVYIAKTDEGFQFGSQEIDSAEAPDDYQDHAFLSDAVTALKAKGFPVPPLAALQKLDPAYQPPGAAKPTPTKQAAAPVAANGLPSMDAWMQTGGQGGSNPGGKFKDPTGQEWYCKFPGDEATAKSEILAAKLYGLAGLSGQDAILVSKGGKVGIATKWVDIKKAPSAAALSKVDGVHSGFAVDAWLGNWDVVGMSLDNLQIGPDGKAHRVDAGGSLEYRAQGSKKPFGAKVDEIDTLRDAAKNPHAAAVFGKMTKADIVASVAKVAAISDVTIRAMVNQHGPGTQDQKAKLAETLIARKADLLKRYPQAAKKKKAVVFDPSKVSAPPSFLNWGGSGKGGPSSKEFLNKANEEAAQAIYQAAKTGNLDAIKSLQANVYDKDTGAVVGSKPALEHPSQHIKGYAQQVINEINYQMNPPKRFRFDGGHPLHSLNAAYPAHHGAPSSAAAQKLGKYIVLGTPGTVKLEDLALPPKITHSSAGGSLNQQTYSPAAQAAIAKMPATQQQAVQSYTGPSHQAMNNSLWAGNPTGAAKSAGEALKTLGHEIAPGTVLSRKINLHGADLEAMLASSGKILQEPAIMSTSIRPSSWSGNVQLKLHVGPGVKGLWVGPGSKPGGGALSKHASEDEIILPPGTRMLIMSVKKGPDSDGFGQHGSHIIEAVILPT